MFIYNLLPVFQSLSQPRPRKRTQASGRGEEIRKDKDIRGGGVVGNQDRMSVLPSHPPPSSHPQGLLAVS